MVVIHKELEQHNALVSKLEDSQPANVANMLYEGMEIEEVQWVFIGLLLHNDMHLYK